MAAVILHVTLSVVSSSVFLRSFTHGVHMLPGRNRSSCQATFVRCLSDRLAACCCVGGLESWRSSRWPPGTVSNFCMPCLLLRRGLGTEDAGSFILIDNFWKFFQFQSLERKISPTCMVAPTWFFVGKVAGVRCWCWWHRRWWWSQFACDWAFPSMHCHPGHPKRLRASPAPLPRTMIRENGKIKVMIMYSSEIQVQRTVGCFV